MSQPNPRFLDDTEIYVGRAREVVPGDWRASAVIVWPDGSFDVGAHNLSGKTKGAAEQVAAAKSVERWEHIERADGDPGKLNKSHPKPGGFFEGR